MPFIHLINSFPYTSLDLEDPSPKVDPINVPFETKIGSEIKYFNTTHPYTPKKTYTDSFKNQGIDFIDRLIDKFK